MSKDNQLVAVITGSSRGIGRGIAKVLGERGATVYVTGRTEVSGTQKSPNGDPVPGSIHEVAEEINKLGGKGIAVAVDLSDDKQIRALFERVQREQGHLNGSGAIPRKCMFLPTNGFLGFMPPRLRTKARERLLFFRSAV